MPCTRKRASESLAASRSKIRMNSRPMILRFSSGSVTAGERRQEVVLGADVHQGDAEVLAEGRLHLLALVEAQQPVVDEDAGQPVADRAVDDERRDGAVDAAGQPADRPGLADLRAHPVDLLLDDVGRGPGGRAVAGLEEEPLQEVGAEGRVHDLGVELDGVEPAGAALHRGDRRAGRLGRDGEAVRRAGDRVAVAHPADLGGQVAEDPPRASARSARSCRTRPRRCGPPRRPAPGPWPACRSRCPAPGSRAPGGAGRAPAPRARRPTPARPTARGRPARARGSRRAASRAARRPRTPGTRGCGAR